jgi:pyrimidine 5'-nucleotidase
MTNKLSHINAVIWDLDDTLYSVTPALQQSMRESVARTMVKMGYDISYEDALALAVESQNKYRLTVKMLVDKFNIDKRDLHLPFHAEMDHTVTNPCPDLPAAFAAVPHVKHVLMTHASRDWAMRMLPHLGIADFFEPHAVLGLEDMNYNHKHESDYVTKACLDILGTNAKNTAFAEDRDWNLTIPHAMGLTTILIDHPSQPKDLPKHVDYRYARAADFLNDMI